MAHFYGSDINVIKSEYLLKATPFHKSTKINFDKHLTEDVFFNCLMSERDTGNEDLETKKINDAFDAKINDVLENQRNPFAKVDLLHIYGYGGCGKTTLIRYLLYRNYNYTEYKHHIIDFEGCEKVIDAYKEILPKTVMLNIKNIDLMFSLMENFNTRRFEKCIHLVDKFLIEIKETYKKGKIKSVEDIYEILSAIINDTIDASLNLYFVVVLDFFFCLLERLFVDVNSISKTNVISIITILDNIDSIVNLDEEILFLEVIRTFINDCNFFIGYNIDNDRYINGLKISDIVSRFKISYFLTTRLATAQKFKELAPDMEKIYGWHSLAMPENYFNHSNIITNRISYYLNEEIGNECERIQELKNIYNFSRTVLTASKFRKLFNNNIRFIIDTICILIKKYGLTGLITECCELAQKQDGFYGMNEGATGMVYSLLFNYFKENDIYSNKLHLTECQLDGKVSLSRIILTIIREQNRHCTLNDIFNLLTPVFEVAEICDVLFSLCELNRDVWRRLITISSPCPKNAAELKELALQYEQGIFDKCIQCEITLCSSGNAYIEDIVPHFEFMLSRHKSEYRYETNNNYHPLYSNSSEMIIGDNNSNCKYLFERKIDWVYNDVKDCCKNCSSFSDELVEHISSLQPLTKEEFLCNTYFNYHPINSEGYSEMRQSYESRLIFRHIGYIEHYRQYLLKKHRNNNICCVDINKRLVTRIKNYLLLYFDKENCYQNAVQTEAAYILKQRIDDIVKSDFHDLITRIEVRDITGNR